MKTLNDNPYLVDEIFSDVLPAEAVNDDEFATWRIRDEPRMTRGSVAGNVGAGILQPIDLIIGKGLIVLEFIDNPVLGINHLVPNDLYVSIDGLIPLGDPGL